MDNAIEWDRKPKRGKETNKILNDKYIDKKWCKEEMRYQKENVMQRPNYKEHSIEKEISQETGKQKIHRDKLARMNRKITWTNGTIGKNKNVHVIVRKI